MNRIRYLAAGLLCLTGIIHVARLGLADAPVVIVVVFGVAYLIIGGLLFRNNKIAYYLGAIEIVVVVSCFSLIKKSWSANKAPKSG